MTGHLAAFLTARLDEDEAVAKAALAGPWHVNRAPAQQGPGLQITDEAGLVVTWTPGFYKRGDSDATHIALNDPARVLREVGAKRAIVGKYERARVAVGFSPAADAYTSDMEWTIRTLAAAYSDHPDYQREWKP